MPYSKLSKGFLEALRSIVGPQHVLCGTQITEDYQRDELAEDLFCPEAVVVPESTEQVSQLLQWAFEHNVPVTTRGSGTGLCGGSVAVEGGIVLSTARMNQILEVDQQNLMAVVQPGVILMEFQKFVEDQGLFYPPDPGEKTATLGGNVSTNAGGMRAVKYGVTRDYVIGLEAVLADGTVIETGGKVVKNSSGYSLNHLLIGSEGTLAVITKLTLKLLPKPEKQISLLVPFPSLREAIETVPRILAAKVVPTAIEFLQREVLEAAEKYLGKQFPDSSAPAYLLLTFYGQNVVELESVYEKTAHVCLDAGAIDVLIANSPDRQESIWQTRGAFLEALKAMSALEEVDVVVPPSEIAAFVQFTKDLEAELEARILSFGHAGDGNLHVYILQDELPKDEWQRRAHQAMDAMYARAKQLRGQVSGEHGIGYAKRPYLRSSLGAAQMQLMRGIKDVFDPKGILNPGKVWSPSAADSVKLEESNWMH